MGFLFFLNKEKQQPPLHSTFQEMGGDRLIMDSPAHTAIYCAFAFFRNRVG